MNEKTKLRTGLYKISKKIEKKTFENTEVIIPRDLEGLYDETFLNTWFNFCGDQCQWYLDEKLTLEDKEYERFVDEEGELIGEWNIDSDFIRKLIKDIDLDGEYRSFVLSYKNLEIDDEIEIYRLMEIANPEQFIEGLKRGEYEGGDREYEGIGICWTDTYESAEDFQEKTSGFGGKNIILEGRVKVKDVDWKDTIVLRLCYFQGEEEQEIRLKYGVDVIIEKIHYLKANRNLLKEEIVVKS